MLDNVKEQRGQQFFPIAFVYLEQHFQRLYLRAYVRGDKILFKLFKLFICEVSVIRSGFSFLEAFVCPVFC